MISDPARPRVVFVNRFYWPDELATAQLLTDLAEGLAAHGGQVVVITSHDGTASMPDREARHGVEIVRVRSTRWGHRGMAAKAADYLTFALAGRRALRAWVRPGDWLVAMTDPPSLAPIAASVARRANARLVHWLQDIHPEISLALSDSRLLAALSGPWMRWRDAAWRSAHASVAISRDMAGLYDRYLGPRWREDAGDHGLWGRVDQIPDEELWRTHERRRERLVAFARGRLRKQLE